MSADVSVERMAGNNNFLLSLHNHTMS